MSLEPHVRLAVIGGGPAGLMAAEVAAERGIPVDLYERMGSVGRKFLIAGKGGLNLTHAEPFPLFVSRYRERANDVERWLRGFDASVLREWARQLGVDTLIGSSGRVFPTDLKAAPLLRGWVRRLRASGVRFHVHQRFCGWDAQRRLRFSGPEAESIVKAEATVLALGGGSWSVLGSDGLWLPALQASGIEVAPLRPANCGFEIDWSPHFAERFAGAPVKPVVMAFEDLSGALIQQRGEFILTREGVEGSLIYAQSAPLRDRIDRDGSVEIRLDLAPERRLDDLVKRISAGRGRRSLADHLRRCALTAVTVGLLHEVLDHPLPADPSLLGATIKSLPLRLRGTRPLDEAISTAGGVRLEALDNELMVRHLPGVFCAGEMLDWEAPTGGYLLTACLASGRVAGYAAADWLGRR